MFKLDLKILFVLVLLLNLQIKAENLKLNNEDQILINSDNLTYDKSANFASFDGNVVLWFNDMVLKTTNIKIYYKQVAGRNKIDKIIIPEKLTAIKNKDSDILIADRAIYSFASNELSLSGNVILQHADNILKTGKLVFITELKKIADH
jgi:lipopolysaccharide export system protein LptA